MSPLLIAALSALWLGILTSISPCPLATNIAAISYLGKQAQDTKTVFANGLLYTIGRTVTYLVLAVIAVTSVLSLPEVLSHAVSPCHAASAGRVGAARFLPDVLGSRTGFRFPHLPGGRP